MKKLLLHSALLIFAFGFAQTFEITDGQSMCMIGKGKGQDATINPYANQTFVLGEYNDKNYSVQLNNKSNFIVIVKVIDKNSGAITQSFGLGAKGKTNIYIDKNETVYLENENKTDAKIDVILSKGVEGMRYIDNNL